MAAVVAFAAATVGLFAVSRGKWSDAIIDSGREWIVPDALARGDLLYRDVVYWFGPFTPYFHAAFFKVLGSSFRSLVIAGIVGSIGVLAALYFALRTVTGRREAGLWTALAVPVLVFMPNAGGSILGMGYRIWHAAAFTLAGIALAARPSPDRRRALRAAEAGALCGLAGLCRTEWGLVAVAGSCLALWLREPSARARWRGVLTTAIAFLVLFGGTLAAFVAAAGWNAVVEDGHVLLTGLPPATREFLVAFSGVRDWRAGIAEMVYSTAMWVGVFFLIELSAVRKRDRERFRRLIPRLGFLLVILALAAVLGGAGGAVIFSAAPGFCLAALVTGLRTRRGERIPALAAFGFLGLLLSYRRPFHITDSAYVGPPLLLAFVSAAGLTTLVVSRERPEVRIRLEKALAAAIIALTGLAVIGRLYGYASDPRVPIPGTGGMLSSRPEVVTNLESVVRAVRRESRKGDKLVVFPEGELLNFLAERPNPIRHKLYIPGYLTDENEDEVLRELERSLPGEVVVLNRSTSEYGPGDFGAAYGNTIFRWIQTAYEVRPIRRTGRTKRIERWAVLMVRRSR